MRLRGAPALLAGVLMAVNAVASRADPDPAKLATPAHSDFDGVWRTSYDRAAKARSGPPGPCCSEEGWDDYAHMLQPWALAAIGERGAALQAGKPMPLNSAQCRPDGVPTVIEIPYAFRFVRTPTDTFILYEADYQWRRIRMDSSHPQALKPSWYGDSIGHWEGKTLVVDTVGLSAKGQLNWDGVQHTEALHVVERYTVSEPGAPRMEMTLSDPGTLTGPWLIARPGSLELTMTVTDAGALTGPWTITKHFQRLNETRLLEYVCAQNNRDESVATE